MFKLCPPGLKPPFFVDSDPIKLTSKKKILIIGDSISIGYFPFVKESLAQHAIVEHNKGNAEHTGTGLQNVIEWVEDGDWDLIHFNWGLWDLCYRLPDSKVKGDVTNRDKIDGTITYSLKDYKKNLEAIVQLLRKKSKARLVFITTSYVPSQEAGRFKQDAIEYNRAAKRIMDKYNISVNDIYERSRIIHKKHGMGNDDVHFTDKGYQELAKLVVSFLEVV